MFRRIKLLPSYKIDWNYNEKDIFGMLRGFDIINKASAQDYFEAGKTKDCDGEIFIITTHFRFCLFFNTCLFSGVKHNTSFLWKIKKKLSYNQKSQSVSRNKMHDWNSHLRIDMIQRLTFENADRMHIFSSKKSVFENKVQRNLNILPFLYVL